jgi:hypothetical protein
MIAASKRSWLRMGACTLLGALVLGMCLGVYVSRRANWMHDKAQEHAQLAAMYSQVVNGIDRLPAPNAKQQAIRNDFQVKFDYHAALSIEYEEARWRPWVSVVESPRR